jgi:hypothetical protein
MSLFRFLKLQDTSSGNTPLWRTEWRSSLPPDCFISRGSISSYEFFLTLKFSWEGVVSTSPNPQAGGPPLVGCLRLLIQFIHSYSPYRRMFLHPQPEDVPCRGERDPHSWELMTDKKYFISSLKKHLIDISICSVDEYLLTDIRY